MFVAVKKMLRIIDNLFSFRFHKLNGVPDHSKVLFQGYTEDFRCVQVP